MDGRVDQAVGAGAAAGAAPGCPAPRRGRCSMPGGATGPDRPILTKPRGRGWQQSPRDANSIAPHPDRPTPRRWGIDHRCQGLPCARWDAVGSSRPPRWTVRPTGGALHRVGPVTSAGDQAGTDRGPLGRVGFEPARTPRARPARLSGRGGGPPGRARRDRSRQAPSWTSPPAPASSPASCRPPRAGAWRSSPPPPCREVFATTVHGVPVVGGTAERIPVVTGAVDAVVVAQAFHWFDAPVALAEMARVLRPGGWLRPDLERAGRDRPHGGRAGPHQQVGSFGAVPGRHGLRGGRRAERAVGPGGADQVRVGAVVGAPTPSSTRWRHGAMSRCSLRWIGGRCSTRWRRSPRPSANPSPCPTWPTCSAPG